MSRTNIGKLVLLTKKLERNKAKIERLIDNLKRQYVATLQALDSLDKQAIEMLKPKIEEAKAELASLDAPKKAPIDIPVPPADATLEHEDTDVEEFDLNPED